MENKFFHFHHMMVPLYYILKTAEDNHTDIYNNENIKEMDLMDQRHQNSVLSKSRIKQVFLSHNPTVAPLLLPEAVVTITWCMSYPVRWIRARNAVSFCMPVSPSSHFWLVSIVSDYQQ